MKRHYLEIDERFPKLDAFADNAVSLVLMNSRILSKINPQVRFDFRFEFFFVIGSVESEKSNIF